MIRKSLMFFCSWRPNEPSSDFQKCVMVNKDFALEWNDESCLKTKYKISKIGQICICYFTFLSVKVLCELNVDEDRQKSVLADYIDNLQTIACGEGWFQSHGTGSCYRYTDLIGNWESGKSQCEEFGAKMAQVESQFEQSFLEKTLTESVWIGSNDLEVEGNFVWNNQAPFRDENM